MVPIESSVEGIVTATLDDLVRGMTCSSDPSCRSRSPSRCSAKPGTTLGDIKTVGGHPQAMPQCRGWLAANLPHSEWIPVASNAEAARQASDGQIDGALAGAFAAARYGLEIVAGDVSDRGNAVTRFVVVSARGPAARADRHRPDVAGRVHAHKITQERCWRS